MSLISDSRMKINPDHFGMAYSRMESAILRDFGRRVRSARDILGWSQEQLADQTQLDRTYISDIERGARNVSLLNMNKLSVALDESFKGFFPH